MTQGRCYIKNCLTRDIPFVPTIALWHDKQMMVCRVENGRLVSEKDVFYQNYKNYYTKIHNVFRDRKKMLHELQRLYGQ